MKKKIILILIWLLPAAFACIYLRINQITDGVSLESEAFQLDMEYLEDMILLMHTYLWPIIIPIICMIKSLKPLNLSNTIKGFLIGTSSILLADLIFFSSWSIGSNKDVDWSDYLTQPLYLSICVSIIVFIVKLARWSKIS